MATKKSSSRRKQAMPVNCAAKLNRFLQVADGIQHYQLRLYVTGNSPRSSEAIANIRSLCDEYLAGRYDLEVVDIYQQPAEAADRQIIAAPTLIKELPVPVKRLVGNLSDRDKVLTSLNLSKKSQATPSVKI